MKLLFVGVMFLGFAFGCSAGSSRPHTKQVGSSAHHTRVELLADFQAEGDIANSYKVQLYRVVTKDDGIFYITRRGDSISTLKEK